MKISSALIGIFWIYLLSDAFLQGLEMPAIMSMVRVPEVYLPWIAVSILALFAGCLVITFWQRRSLMEDLPLVTRFVDTRFGEGTYKEFSKRLRPVAIATLSTLVLAVSSLGATFSTTKNLEGYLAGFTFLAIALGLLAAYFLSRRYPPRLQ